MRIKWVLTRHVVVGENIPICPDCRRLFEPYDWRPVIALSMLVVIVAFATWLAFS